jgi:hypothetical protein
MTGNEMPARIQGTVLSSLFALFGWYQLLLFITGLMSQTDRAISIAPADQGFVNSIDGFGTAGLPGCRLEGDDWRSEGDRSGEEKERR